MKAPLPPNELQRLAVLAEYEVMDTPPEVELDEITELAAALCDVPVAMISLIDVSRQWFKSKVGSALVETPRDLSFCAHALGSGQLLNVPDAAMDPRFKNNPLVTGEPKLRFYAGAPLVTPEGAVLGTLCVMGFSPKILNEHQAKILAVLSRDVMIRLDLKRQKRAQRSTELALLQSAHAQRDLEGQLALQARRLVEARDLARMGSWEVEISSMTVTWSDEVYRIFELRQLDFKLSWESFAEFVHPEDRQAVKEAFRANLTQVGAIGIGHRILLRGGRIKYVEERWQMTFDGNRQPLRAIGTCQDVTARWQAEDGLLRSQTLLRMGERLGRMGAWSVDISGMQLTWSDQVFAVHRLPRSFELTVERALGFYELSDQASIRAAFETCVTHGTPFDLELQLIAGDGQKIWVRSIGESIRGADGKVVRVQGAIQDISERKSAESAVHVSEERFRLLSRATDDAILDWDMVTDRLWCNEGYGRLFGLSDEVAEAGRESWALNIHPEDRDRVTHSLQRVIEKNDSVWSAKYRYRTRDGSYAYVLNRAYVIRDVAGKAVRMVGGMTDLTTQHKIEEDVRRASRALQMLNRSGKAVIRATDEASLLAEVCRIAVEVGGMRMAWVGYFTDDAAKRVDPKAHFSKDSALYPPPALTWSDEFPADVGPAGHVARTGQKVVIGDFSISPEFSHWRGSAEARTYAGVVCLPLKDKGRPFGVVVMYLPEQREVPEDESNLLQDMADDLAFGLLTLHSEAERKKVNQTVFDVARGISSVGGSDFFEKITRSLQRALSADAAFIAEYVSAQPGTATTLFALVDGQVVSNFSYHVAGTPCERLSAKEVFLVPKDVKILFPQARELVGTATQGYAGIELQDERGRAVGLMGVHFDREITQPQFVSSILQIFAVRTAGELARREVDQKTREQAALINEARDAIIVRDLSHRVTFWSKGAERLFGWSAAEAVGKVIHELLKVDRAQFDEADQIVRTKGLWDGEIQKHGKSGTALILYERWSILRNARGEPSGIFTIETDMTEQRKAEHHLLRAQRMDSIGTLAGGIAHDLNNALAPITLCIGMLRETNDSPENILMIDQIEFSAKRGSDLVKQLLSFARGEAGVRVGVSVLPSCNEVASVARNTFPKNITVRSRFDDDLWLVVADQTQLHQVLMNLCVNARDAMPGGGTLSLSASNVEVDAIFAATNGRVPAGRYVLLEVRDNGVGIPRANLERIFEPFFTTKEIGKGTGLGLATVLGIVRTHGGFVDVQSESNVGTAFKVYLPIANRAVDPAEVRRERSLLLHGHGEMILVVDDEPMLLSAAKRSLQKYGYRVLTAENGAAAMGVYAANKDDVALVLTDMMMPIMDGPALVSSLRHINPKIKIIGSSGQLTAGIDRANNSELRHFIGKPYSIEELLALLDQVLREKDA